MSQGWVIAIHVSCLIHSLCGGPQFMSISAGQHARRKARLPNIADQIDWAFFVLVGQPDHCQDAWIGYVKIAASFRKETAL